MYTNRIQKKVIKAVAGYQRNGIVEGDTCPRCGESTMGAKSVNIFICKRKIFVCNNCGLEMSLAAFLGDEDYSKWYVNHPVPRLPAPVQSVYETVPKFQIGDHVIDTRTDFGGIVIEALDEGLYNVIYDGENAVQVLQDEELVWDVSTLEAIEHRISAGSKMRIYKAKEMQLAELPQIVTIDAVTDSCCLEVLTDKGEKVTVYPDIDCFSLIA